MVLTWIGDVRPLLDKQRYFSYWQRLPGFRQKKADRLHTPMGRALSVGAWVLLQQARETFCLTQDAPFNLSHSGFYALCCAAINTETKTDSPVQAGCDIEQVSGCRENIARRFFCPEEYRHIMAQEDAMQRQELFFRYWVLKESFMKATRQGMAMPLDSFSLKIKDGAAPMLSACPAPYKKEDYYFQEFSLASYKAAVCSTDPDIAPKLLWTAFD